MKRILPILLLIWCAPAAFGAITYTGVHAAASSANTTSATTSAIDTSGSILLVACGSNSASGTPALTDSKSNSWTALTVRTSTTKLSCFYVASPTVGAGHTFTNTTGVAFPSIAVIGFTGTHASAPFDTQNGAAPMATLSSLAAGNISPSASTNVAIAALSLNNTTLGMAVDSGFTITDNQDLVGGTSYPIVMAYKLTLGGSENPTFSWTTASDPVAEIASFKQAGSGTATRNGMLLGILP